MCFKRYVQKCQGQKNHIVPTMSSFVHLSSCTNNVQEQGLGWAAAFAPLLENRSKKLVFYQKICNAIRECAVVLLVYVCNEGPRSPFMSYDPDKCRD